MFIFFSQIPQGKLCAKSWSIVSLFANTALEVILPPNPTEFCTLFSMQQSVPHNNGDGVNWIAELPRRYELQQNL